MKSYKQKLIQKLSEYHLARSSINVYLCSSADKRPRSDIVWELYLDKKWRIPKCAWGRNIRAWLAKNGCEKSQRYCEKRGIDYQNFDFR